MFDNQTLQVISLVLAIVIGIVAFGLVKCTADEFDRWYEGDELRQNFLKGLPAGLIVSVLVTFSLFLR